MIETSVLVQMGPELWVADGPRIRFYGMPFPTRMTVVRLADGGLWLHSPVEPTPALQAALATLGTVRHLVAPNWIHYAWVSRWQGPGITSWAAPGVRERAATRQPDLRVDELLGAETATPWQDQISQRLVTGSAAHQEVVFYHQFSKSLILTDLIENMEAPSLPLWLRPLARLAGIVAPHGRMPLDMWLSFSGHRQELRDHLKWMLAHVLDRVSLAHGPCLTEDMRGHLIRGFRRAGKDLS